MAYDFLKKLFPANEDGTPKAMTFEELEAAISADKGISLVNLKDGGYVSQDKFDRKQQELAQAQSSIETLNGTIAKNTTDLEELQNQIKAAEGDASKIAALTNQVAQLQTDAKTAADKYDQQQKDFQDQLAKQACEFAIKTKVGGLKFSSASAKRAFTQDILGAGLKVDGENVLGFDDYVAKYKAEIDPDAFAKEEEPKEPEPKEKPPIFTGGSNSSGNNRGGGDFSNLFHFSQVNPVRK